MLFLGTSFLCFDFSADTQHALRSLLCGKTQQAWRQTRLDNRTGGFGWITTLGIGVLWHETGLICWAPCILFSRILQLDLCYEAS